MKGTASQSFQKIKSKFLEPPAPASPPPSSVLKGVTRSFRWSLDSQDRGAGEDPSAVDEHHSSRLECQVADWERQLKPAEGATVREESVRPRQIPTSQYQKINMLGCSNFIVIPARIDARWHPEIL
jgi:hypothetical protein